MDKYARCNDTCPDYAHTHINLMTGAMYPSEVAPDRNVWTAEPVFDYDPKVVSEQTLSTYIDHNHG